MKDGSRISNNIKQIIQVRSPSLKTGRQNINAYYNINNKSTNSKYHNYSSMKKKYNPQKNFTIDSEKNKALFDNVEEEDKNYEMLATNVRVQNKILEEYQNWVNILLSVIDIKKINNSYDDIGTPIQQGLEHIEKLKVENLQLKTLIINKKSNNDNMEKILEKKQKTQNMVIKEFNEKDKKKEINLKREKEQLILNVQMLANELDELNENNKHLYEKIEKDDKIKKIYELYNLRNQLKEENKLHKKIMVFKNRKEYIDLKQSLNFSSNQFNMNNLKNKKFDKLYKSEINFSPKEYGSIGRLSAYGEYKLEKEENIDTSDSIFFCGL